MKLGEGANAGEVVCAPEQLVPWEVQSEPALTEDPKALLVLTDLLQQNRAGFGPVR